MQKVFMLIALLTAPAISASVAAETVKNLTVAAKQPASFASFISVLKAEGANNHVRPNVAPLLALTPNAPTKAYLIYDMDPNSPREPGKTCNMLIGDATSYSDSGHSIFLDGYADKNDLIVRYFKADQKGKLLLAVHTLVKRDEKKQAIRGSGKATTLDVTSPAVQREFKKELDFWLSGKYKKYLKPATKDVPFRGK